MKKIEVEIPDVYYRELRTFVDPRGEFTPTWDISDFSQEFLQDNESLSTFGVVRGLHYQKPPYTQAKLIRVIRGSIQDVIVDIRSDSPTFGKTYSIILNYHNRKQLFVPRGFAHGFISLEYDTIVQYKVDNHYMPSHEAGIRFDDKFLGIKWMIPNNELIVSEKDKLLPDFKHLEPFTKFQFNLNPD